MVEFGKRLSVSIEGSQWQQHYLDYKRLKKIVKSPSSFKSKDRNDGGDDDSATAIKTRSAPELLMLAGTQQKMGASPSPPGVEFIVSTEFQKALDEEIEKVVLFLLEEQGRISQNLGRLSNQRQSLVGQVTHLLQEFQLVQEEYGGSTTDVDGDRTTNLEEYNRNNNTIINIGPVLTSLQTNYESYQKQGLMMLKFVKYVELNVTAVRKILKKHDKAYPRHKLGRTYLERYTNDSVDSHLNQLYHYGGLSALLVTLQHAFQELHVLEITLLWMQQETMGSSSSSKTGTRSDDDNKESPNHRRVRSLPPLLLMEDDLLMEEEPSATTERVQQQTAEEPDGNGDDDDNANTSSTVTTARKILSYFGGSGVGSGIGTQQYHHPIVADPSTSTTTTRGGDGIRSSPVVLLPSIQTLITSTNEPIVEQIHVARSRLVQSTNYVHVMAAQSAMFFEDEYDDDEDTALIEEDLRKQRTKRTKAQELSSFLNLCSTFLYMTNYYIVAPTCGTYATKLGSTEAMAGIIIGMTPNAALIATVLYGWWSNYSYKSALIFAAGSSIVGNICYALALQQDSLALVMIGRFFNGFGSARSINRRFIADSFSRQERTAASAAFVTAGALGMAAGPAIAAIVAKSFTSLASAAAASPEEELTDEMIGGDSLLWTVETAPGWIMLGFWSIYFLSAIFFFEEPDRSHLFGNTTTVSTKQVPEEHAIQLTTSAPTETEDDGHGHQDSESRPLLDYKSTKIYHELPRADTMDSAKSDSSRKKGRFSHLHRLTPVMVTLWIYFVLKLVLEALCSSCATITNLYFGWDSQITGAFLAILGLLIFPANMIVAKLSHRYEDRELIYATLIIMMVSVLGIISYRGTEHYSVYQYVIFGICIFVSTNILEGPNMGLLSKTLPKSWAKGIFNSGFLATEAGTLARSVGDVMISAAAALVSNENLLNATFLLPFAMILSSVGLVWKYFDHMIEDDDDDDTRSTRSSSSLEK